MSTFADLIPEDVWSSVDTARTAAGVVANHTSAVVKAFSEVEWFGWFSSRGAHRVQKHDGPPNWVL